MWGSRWDGWLRRMESIFGNWLCEALLNSGCGLGLKGLSGLWGAGGQEATAGGMRVLLSPLASAGRHGGDRNFLAWIQSEEGILHGRKGKTHTLPLPGEQHWAFPGLFPTGITEGRSPPCMTRAWGGIGSAGWPTLTRSCKPG